MEPVGVATMMPSAAYVVQKRPSTWTRGALAPASNEAEFEDG